MWGSKLTEEIEILNETTILLAFQLLVFVRHKKKQEITNIKLYEIELDQQQR